MFKPGITKNKLWTYFCKSDLISVGGENSIKTKFICIYKIKALVLAKKCVFILILLRHRYVVTFFFYISAFLFDLHHSK